MTSNTLRQAVTPDALLGRVAAGSQALGGTLGAVGGVAGGLLGAALGLRGALVAASAGMSLMAVWIALSPVRSAAGSARTAVQPSEARP